MARYTGPKCRLCRREGVQLFLKGARCESSKCAILRRQQAPGQHGTSRRPLSPFGQQLREKQKAKRIYGVLERQLRKYFREAEKQGGESGEALLEILERRLDNVVYRLGLAHSRAHARKLISQKKIKYNDAVVDIPSLLVEEGGTIAPGDASVFHVKGGDNPPSWLKLNRKTKEGRVVALPVREEITEPIEEQLIVEYYSR